MDKIIDGAGLAQKMQDELQEEVVFLEKSGIKPGLAVLLVGDDPASQIYVRNKERRANAIGIKSVIERLPQEITQIELLEKIEKYNQDRSIDGILVQLPLPVHIDSETVLNAILPSKDVDGFHPVNVGKLSIGKPDQVPCTPYGIIKMLEAYNVAIEGKNAVIIGRSNIVGKPIANLLLARNATVTITHSKTENLAKICAQADILVVAIGRGHFVTKDFIKPGATVIDVGMNRDEQNHLIGDVKTDEVKEVAGLITPVPKGVGPMTITMLLYQTIKNAKKKQ